MDSSTPTFAGLKGQPLVLAVTLTSGLGFLYDHMCPIIGMEQLIAIAHGVATSDDLVCCGVEATWAQERLPW
jgi:hypothetical protein